jgi:uncharacterized protein (TIGR03000 family)
MSRILSALVLAAPVLVLFAPGSASAQLVITGRCGRLVIGAPAGDEVSVGWGNYPGSHGFVPGYGYAPNYSYDPPTWKNPIIDWQGRFAGEYHVGRHAVPAEPAAPAEVATFTVRVPADAEIWFTGGKTEQRGEERVFVSPPLPSGRELTYDVRVRWSEKGVAVEQTRAVRVRPGDRIELDFRPPSQVSTRTHLP